MVADYEYAVALASCYMDAWVVTSKPTATDYVVRFESTWDRVQKARFTAEWRYIIDTLFWRFIGTVLAMAILFLIYNLGVEVYNLYTSAKINRTYDMDDFEYDDEL